MGSTPDAEVLLYRGFFSPAESETLFQKLVNTIHWKQHQVELPTETIFLPRLSAWYGDEGKSYSYSGITVDPELWTPTLLMIKKRVEAASGATFNSVLLNFYRYEQDSVSWHSDDEPELDTNPVIGSISLGATRSFQFKHKYDAEVRLAIDLTSGSFLLMRGTTQHFWKHQVPKTKSPHGPRINLTFRFINK